MADEIRICSDHAELVTENEHAECSSHLYHRIQRPGGTHFVLVRPDDAEPRTTQTADPEVPLPKQSSAYRIPLRYRCTDSEHRACTGCQPAWREMLEDAEARLNAVLAACDRYQGGGMALDSWVNVAEVRRLLMPRSGEVRP